MFRIDWITVHAYNDVTREPQDLELSFSAQGQDQDVIVRGILERLDKESREGLAHATVGDLFIT